MVIGEVFMNTERNRRYVIIVLVIILYCVPVMDFSTEVSEDISVVSYEENKHYNSDDIDYTGKMNADDYFYYTEILKSSENYNFIRRCIYALLLLLNVAVSYGLRRRIRNCATEKNERGQIIIEFIHEKDGTKGKRLL